MAKTPNSAPHAPKALVDYLIEMYKLYHGHINTMFNYFLVAAGLFVTAWVQLISKDSHASYVAVSLPIVGATVTIVSLLVHLRSRRMLDVIETQLKSEEAALFGAGRGFLNPDEEKPAPFYLRHRYQFVAIYLIVLAALVAMASYSALHISDDARTQIACTQAATSSGRVLTCVYP